VIFIFYKQQSGTREPDPGFGNGVGAIKTRRYDIAGWDAWYTVIDSKDTLKIDFGARGNSTQYCREGWCSPEARHTWTSGIESVLELPRPDKPGTYLLDMAVGPFVYKAKIPAQHLSVVVNGNEVGSFEVTEPTELECKLPWALVAQHNPVSVVFRHPKAAKPRIINGVPDDRVIALAFETITLLRSLDVEKPLEAPHPPSGETDAKRMPVKELVSKFENLGENCEFGLVQRRAGAEPLGLLRFSSTPLSRLIAGMQARFEGIGQRDLVEVEVSQTGREYMVKDKKFGFLYHPWVKRGEASASEIYERECRRLPFLTKKLIEDLEAADKIFVYRGMRPLAESAILRLLSAMRGYGPTTLLWVELADEANPSGSVKSIATGLLKGHIDRFAPGENAHDLSFDVWVTICRNAYRIYQEMGQRA
jgi:hypothetical protein